MDKREVYDSVIGMINKATYAATEETVQEVIYEAFPLSKVECVYNSSLHTLNIRIRYFCYGEGQELNIKYFGKTTREILTHEFLNRVIDDIANKVKEKISEKENEDEDE